MNCLNCGKPIAQCPDCRAFREDGVFRGWLHQKPDGTNGSHYCWQLGPVAEPSALEHAS